MAIAIIGTGWGARIQAPAFRSAGLNVVALAGSDQAKTARIAGELGIPFATGDWHAVLAHPDVTLVSIVTPPDLHCDMALAALAAGKHVLCEKPTALEAAQARTMLAAAQAHPHQLALIDHELRFLPALIRARQLIADGAIGPVRHALFQVIGSSRVDGRGWNWWSDAARGGGALGAYGSHQTDLLRYLLGAEVEAVAASLSTFIAERDGPDGPRAVTSDDYYSLRLRFAGATLATIECSAVARTNEPNSLTLYGTEGTLRWAGGALLHGGPDGTLRDISPAHTHPLPAGLRAGEFPHGTVYLAHALRAFLAGDAAALAPSATFADGLRTQLVLDAARASDRQGGGYQQV